MPEPCLLIAVPSKGEIKCNFFLSIVELSKELHAKNIRWGLIICEDGNVDTARNEAVHHFLKDPGLTHLMFIDSDVGFAPDAITKLLAHSVPIVCGVYPLRKLPQAFKTSILDVPPQPKTGLLVAIGVPAGFMLIERWVIEKLAKDYAHRTYQQSNEGKGKDVPHETRVALFEHELCGDRYYSEDVNFCRRCVAAGLLIHVDPTIEFTHQGDHLFSGKLDDVLKPKPDPKTLFC